MLWKNSVVCITLKSPCFVGTFISIKYISHKGTPLSHADRHTPDIIPAPKYVQYDHNDDILMKGYEMNYM